MNIIYFVIGNSIVIHTQVGFSIRTFLAQMTVDDTIYVVTDTPQMYAGLPQVITITVSQDEIKQWRGPHDFFWRVKIMVLCEIVKMSPEKPIMYLDGDTFLFGSLTEIKHLLNNNCGMMHKDEGCPSAMKDKSLKMWETVGGSIYGDITIGTHHHMWNAGVVAIPASLTAKVTDLALRICDGMLDDHAEPIVVEQYALSIALKECTEEMIEANKWIGHYWHNKYYWSKFIAKFFVRSYRLGASVTDDVKRIKSTNLKRVHQWILLKRTMAKLSGRLY